MDAENLLMDMFTNLLGDNIDEIRADICYNNAISAIKEYINKDSIDVVAVYPYQIAQLAFYYYKTFDDIQYQTKSQGSRSVTLVKGIPEEIKRTLPRYVKPF